MARHSTFHLLLEHNLYKLTHSFTFPETLTTSPLTTTRFVCQIPKVILDNIEIGSRTGGNTEKDWHLLLTSPSTPLSVSDMSEEDIQRTVPTGSTMKKDNMYDYD